MTPERFEEVVRLYRVAMQLDAAQRPQFLAEACAGDEALRAEVTALLNSDLRDGQLLDRPTLELAGSSLTGRRVGHCRLLSLLGKGGMGEVWLAEDTQLGRKVAVKLLPAAFTHEAERVRRFVQEARAASALNHRAWARKIKPSTGWKRHIRSATAVSQTSNADPKSDSLRSDAPFKDLLRRMGMPQ